nr:BrnA antitoxin family protein [Tianweitania sediminis]
MSSGAKKLSVEGGRGEDAPRRPGRPRLENAKQPVSLRLEPEVLAKFKATGPGWQKRMNDVLKAAILDHEK